jgi:hypothetical protein
MTTIQEATAHRVMSIVYVYYRGNSEGHLDSIWDDAVDAKAHACDLRKHDGIQSVYVIPRAVWKRT